jgi:TrmH family RNA methyltransferase
MSEVITSKDNLKVKEAYKNKDGKGEYFLVEGFHLVEMALRSKTVSLLFSIQDYPAAVPTYLVTPEIITKLSSTLHPEGIVALCKKTASRPLSSPRLLYLDHVSDPGNVGTLLRTALAFGYQDVVLSEGSAEVYSSKVLLASQGAIFSLNVTQSKQMAKDDLSLLKNAGYTVISTSLKDAKAPEEIPVKGKLALILGNEARGVQEELLSGSDAIVKIPMGGIDSLNVGVAGGILMYLFQGKRA